MYKINNLQGYIPIFYNNYKWNTTFKVVIAMLFTWNLPNIVPHLYSTKKERDKRDIKTKCMESPWHSSGSDSASNAAAWEQSIIWELRSHMPCGQKPRFISQTLIVLCFYKNYKYFGDTGKF